MAILDAHIKWEVFSINGRETPFCHSPLLV